MSRNPPTPKLPRKVFGPMTAELDDISQVQTGADDPSNRAEGEPTVAHSRGRARMSKHRVGSDPNYSVGYRRPPKQFRFKPGQSGNPKGRSPQSRNLKTMVNKVVGEQVQIREGGRVRRMPKIEALIRTLMSRAFKGDPKATAAFIVMMKHSGYGAEAAGNTPELLQGVDHEAIIEEFLARVALQDSMEVDSPSDDLTEVSDPSKTGKA